MLLLIDIGEEISKRRKAVGLTQAELAKMAREPLDLGRA
jgi:hypothetical protein